MLKNYPAHSLGEDLEISYVEGETDCTSPGQSDLKSCIIDQFQLLENFKNCSGLQLSSDPQSELCPKNGFVEGFPDYSLSDHLVIS